MSFSAEYSATVRTFFERFFAKRDAAVISEAPCIFFCQSGATAGFDGSSVVISCPG